MGNDTIIGNAADNVLGAVTAATESWPAEATISA
jgi:hypothetical protein